jgi:mRNA interferase MazF
MQAKVDHIIESQQQFQQEPTPLEFRNDLGMWLKRDDKSFCGSHKFRPMAWQLGNLAAISKSQIPISKVVVPTSGNAGIAAAMIGRELGIEVWCFVHPDVDRAKAVQIQKAGGKLFTSDRSVRYSGFVHKTQGIPRLRQSFDTGAVEGYWSLAAEIADQLPDCDAIFTFATSGTSSLGIYEGYCSLGKPCPDLHIVQSGISSSIAEEFSISNFQFPNTSQILNPKIQAAGKGGLANTRRHEDVVAAIRDTGGSAHYVGADEIFGVDLDTSAEGKACIVAATEYLADNPGQKVVVICSGRGWEDDGSEVKMERCEEVFGQLPSEVRCKDGTGMQQFDFWNAKKKSLEQERYYRGFEEGDIMFLHMGKNIGFEQNGKGDSFVRPVLVFRKFSNAVFLGIPLSRTSKRGVFYYPFSLVGKGDSVALLSQIRLFDSKRLLNKIGSLSTDHMKCLKQKLSRLLRLTE